MATSSQRLRQQPSAPSPASYPLNTTQTLNQLRHCPKQESLTTNKGQLQTTGGPGRNYFEMMSHPSNYLKCGQPCLVWMHNLHVSLQHRARTMHSGLGNRQSAALLRLLLTNTQNHVAATLSRQRRSITHAKKKRRPTLGYGASKRFAPQNHSCRLKILTCRTR